MEFVKVSSKRDRSVIDMRIAMILKPPHVSHMDKCRSQPAPSIAHIPTTMINAEIYVMISSPSTDRDVAERLELSNELSFARFRAETAAWLQGV
eukprot:1075770-Rhodomonas_salina.1